MEKETYFTVQSWMVKKLHLTGNELIVYAIIHGFSQDGQSYFYGSLDYLAEETGVAKRNIVNILARLVEKKLIFKKTVKTIQRGETIKTGRGSQHFCLYFTGVSRGIITSDETSPATSDETSPATSDETSPATSDETSPPTSDETSPPTSDETSPNNKAYKLDNTATADNTKQKFALQEKAAVDSVTDTLKNLFGGRFVFDSSFVPVIKSLGWQFNFSENELTDYLKYVYEKARLKNPDSLTNLFYTMAKSPACMQDFVMTAKKSAPEAKKSAPCPVCGGLHADYGVCRTCGFDLTRRNDEAWVEQQKQIFNLSPEMKAAMNEELSRALYTGGDFSPAAVQNRNKLAASIYAKYGIKNAGATA